MLPDLEWKARKLWWWAQVHL